MTGDAITAALTEALTGWPIGEPCQFIGPEEATELMTFLLPVVRKAQAEALRAAADEMPGGAPAAWLRDRAAALEAGRAR